METTYPKHSMVEFEKDIGFVVKSILDSPFPEMGNRSFRDIFNFSKSKHAKAKNAAREMIDNSIPTKRDIRVLLAASRMAFEKHPEEYNKTMREKVLNHIKNIQGSGTRGVRDVDTESIKRKKQDFDKREGEHLFNLLKALC